MEVKKLIAFLILNYNVISSFNTKHAFFSGADDNIQVHIIDPKTFQVENIWFFAQKGLNAWIEKREESTSTTPIIV